MGQRITVAGRLRISVSAIAAFGLSVPLALSAQGIVPAEFPGPMQLIEPVSQAKSPGDVYIVQLKDAGAASYKGETAGFSATKPASGERFDASAPNVDSYVNFLAQKHDAVLNDIGGGEKLYSFRYALNGFSAVLTPTEVTRLARHPEVTGIWRDRDHRLATNNSSLFLGLLDQTGGLRADLKLTGEDVVVAVIDSGIDPTHPAIMDFEEEIPSACRSAWGEGSWLGFLLCRPILRNPPSSEVYDPPAGFSGICQEGQAFPATSCNNKLIGARYYNDGFLARHELDAGEYLSAKDVDGHGTHIATTIAGNVVSASLFGTRIGEISGIAPRARIAVYKACWLEPGNSRATCTSSDLARAIDDAVADGSDIINYSIGSLETDLTAPEDIALLNAVDAGVLSIVAAGNDGPANFTLGTPGSAPWVVTVGASTQSGTRYEQAIEISSPNFQNRLAPMVEGNFTLALSTSDPLEADLVLVDDGQDVLGAGGAGSFYDACEEPINASELAGSVALIERGGCTFQVKLEQVEAAGAVGAVVFTTTGAPIEMNGESGSVAIPAVMIGPADGSFLVDAYLAGDEPVVRLEYGLLADIQESGNQMAAFSSRGPAISDSDFLKPDLTAPGVNILAGSTPDLANGTKGQYFGYLSGTSMAAPMVAGIAALLKEAEPDWSPAAIKSALMTTARDDVVAEDSAFLANPFDMGSGHINANEALTPGLVYESSYEDFRAYLCGTDTSIVDPGECAALQAAGYPTSARQVNLPSIAITEMIPGDQIVRRLTNLGPAATYDVTIEAPAGMSVSVEPSSLGLNTGESADYRLLIDNQSAPYEFWQFGNVNWTDGTHTLNSPIAAQPAYLRAPRDIQLSALDGSGEIPVAFGYTGDYVLDVHGMSGPGFRESGVVADDPDNDYSFRLDNGVTAHYFTLGPDELYLRVSLFDSLTDGQDDLDLYLYHCPTLSTCTEVGHSGSFTSDEQIDVLLPESGLYTAHVHGFETDDATGGPGSNYEILAWSISPGDDAGNFRVDSPAMVTSGDRLDLAYDWGPLDPDTIYLGAISHDTPFDVFFLTIVSANTP
jgi:subtilisin family serine protease